MKSAHAPARGWRLNGLRFVSPGLHGNTETFHADDFPVYAAAPDLLAAAKAISAYFPTLLPSPGVLPNDKIIALRAAIALAS